MRKVSPFCVLEKDGLRFKVGKDMNVINDVIFEGRILEQVEKAIDFIRIRMKEKITHFT